MTNTPEESLDLTLIEHLSQYSAPRIVAPGWAVRIDVHFLGGMRHFRSWEIADIGLMVFAKENNRTVGNKVAILQSKRLYPIVGEIAAETPEDYQIGMGRLVSDRITATSLTQAKTFQFTGELKYKTLAKDDRQYKAIAEYESTLQIPVHYLFYNPWVVPSAYSFPLEAEPALGAKANGGCRIIPASSIRACLMPKNVNYTPRFNA